MITIFCYYYDSVVIFCMPKQLPTLFISPIFRYKCFCCYDMYVIDCFLCGKRELFCKSINSKRLATTSLCQKNKTKNIAYWDNFTLLSWLMKKYRFFFQVTLFFFLFFFVPSQTESFTTCVPQINTFGEKILQAFSAYNFQIASHNINSQKISSSYHTGFL